MKMTLLRTGRLSTREDGSIFSRTYAGPIPGDKFKRDFELTLHGELLEAFGNPEALVIETVDS